MPKDFSDFLLSEYENISKAYFVSQENVSKWVRYYLLVLGVPLAIFSIASKENNYLDQLIEPISLALIAVGLVSSALSLIIYDHRLDCTVYARTVNGIRKYFVECENQEKDNSFKILQYIVLPIDSKKPSMTGGDTRILKWLFISINIIYIEIGLYLEKKYLYSIGVKHFIMTLAGISLFIFFNKMFDKLSSDKDCKYKALETTTSNNNCSLKSTKQN